MEKGMSVISKYLTMLADQHAVGLLLSSHWRYRPTPLHTTFTCGWGESEFRPHKAMIPYRLSPICFNFGF